MLGGAGRRCPWPAAATLLPLLVLLLCGGAAGLTFELPGNAAQKCLFEQAVVGAAVDVKFRVIGEMMPSHSPCSKHGLPSKVSGPNHLGL